MPHDSIEKYKTYLSTQLLMVAADTIHLTLTTRAGSPLIADDRMVEHVHARLIGERWARAGIKQQAH